eukprot:CAMPEP_0177389258 /NCGR_PEP_ID=MMETSP0368-20130122/52444_1 /TAXON_ID=447022 ORGANISM="Scrippsiella hangoei-like, Strain SHHI-4" /NCGR_SAMPLE_ID=MMETSP0368 /ASSEMBLY_ACC=CAM_ASM_000363 /LENGTH=65 /DNA_ID=CAMNT_0018854607 /DNA_START=14 /DNA_END=208 /DNA_ORIENTATION=-
MPHGYGIQHFPDKTGGKKGQGGLGGTYMGQFFQGQRHGRGVWVTNDSTWRYRPIQQRGVPNWERD